MHFLFMCATFMQKKGVIMDFQHYFKSRRGEMIHLLKDLVHLESPTSDKKAVNECSSFALKEFKKTGAKVNRFPQDEIGHLYLIEYPGKKTEQPEEQILLLTHIDTVWSVGKIKQMPFYVSGDKIFGPGVLDMKAGLAMAIFSLRTMHDLNIRPHKKIVVFINSAEETQSEASEKLIKKQARRSTYVLCLEPSLPGGILKMERKGRLVVKLECKGKAAHAGTPEQGINAIDELLTHLRQLSRLKTKQITMNIGLIGGGEKANIVADQAWTVLDFRFWKNSQKEKILSALKQLQPAQSGARVRYSVESLTPPMEKTKTSTNLLYKARKIASTLNMELEAGKTGGGSDGSIASSLGIPTLDGLGPEGEGIHSENEHLLLSSYIQRTALLTEMLCQL
jgi:glutamate carboxypeptidase